MENYIGNALHPKLTYFLENFWVWFLCVFGNYLAIALCESLVSYHFQDDGGVCLVTEKIWETGGNNKNIYLGSPLWQMGSMGSLVLELNGLKSHSPTLTLTMSHSIMRHYPTTNQFNSITNQFALIIDRRVVWRSWFQSIAVKRRQIWVLKTEKSSHGTWNWRKEGIFKRLMCYTEFTITSAASRWQIVYWIGGKWQKTQKGPVPIIINPEKEYDFVASAIIIEPVILLIFIGSTHTFINAHSWWVDFEAVSNVVCLQLNLKKVR